MNAITPTAPRCGAILGLAACAAVMLLLCGCHKAVSTEGQAAAAPDEKDKGDEAKAGEAKDKAGEAGEEGVSLKPEEIEKMGIVTTEARAITSEPEVAGYGVVAAHETIATAVAV